MLNFEALKNQGLGLSCQSSFFPKTNPHDTFLSPYSAKRSEIASYAMRGTDVNKMLNSDVMVHILS